MSRTLWKIGLVVAVALPSLGVRLSGLALSPVHTILVFGAGVVAASFLLAWAAEVAQLDISASFATAILALIAVLPEYAVDLYFAFTAGHRPEYGAYAAANMTGSNRLLIGIGWPLVAVLFAAGLRKRGEPSRAVVLRPRRRVELAFLAVAGLYAMVIPVKRTLSVIDAVVLLALFGGYLWRTSRQEQEEPELHGIPAQIGQLPTSSRRATVVAFFVGAAVLIALAAKPFADGLVDGGRQLGVDEFLLVQWLAPLSSEAPELIVAGILASRGDDETALGTLLSSKVNQWTLLVGSLPVAHALGGGGFTLPLDARQNEEFLLTAAQAVFALALLLGLRLRATEALLLFITFAAQFLFPQEGVRLVFAGIYGALALVLFAMRSKTIIPTLRALLRNSEATDSMEANDDVSTSSRGSGEATTTVTALIAAKSDVGRVRTNNEDAFGLLDLTRGTRLETGPTAVELPIGEDGLLLALSDGMGGHQAGEVASALVLESLYTGLRTGGDGPIASKLDAAVRTANGEVFHAARAGNKKGMGATLTAVLVRGNEAYLAQVGDSRAYLLRSGELRQLSRDQSLVQMLVDGGLMSIEDAKNSPQKNVILQAMGLAAEVKVAIGRLDLRCDDVVLLCCDGLSNAISDDELRSLLLEHAPAVACERLVALANERGGEDNLTAIIARFAGSGLAHPTGADTSTFEVLQDFTRVGAKQST